jgi:hypothetical protein
VGEVRRFRVPQRFFVLAVLEYDDEDAGWPRRCGGRGCRRREKGSEEERQAEAGGDRTRIG